MSMVNGPIRLTAALTHPVQYYTPWFRHIATHCPEIDLTVLYATRPTPSQQGVGFGRALEWDVALTEGYHCCVVRSSRGADSVHSDEFWGLDVPEMVAAVRETQPDVVLVPGWHSVTLLRVLWACRRARLPVLYRGDTHLGRAPIGWRRPLWSPRTRLLLGLFDGYLSVGRRARAYLRHFGVDDSRVFPAPHCVDNEFFAARAARYQTPGGRVEARVALGLDARDFVVLFVGKMEPKKRPLDLIRAMGRLGAGSRLLMVGTGELEQECRAEAARLGAPVAWAGFLNQSELGRTYAAADCLVLPSDWGETWGLVVNEALATGLPCVVSDRVGCAPDLVTPGETGEIFPMGDVAALTAAVARVRDQRGAGHDWAPACRRRADSYSLERAADGLSAGCRAVVDRHTRRPRPTREPLPKPRVIACCGGMVVVGGLERITFEALRVLRERGAVVHCVVNSWENHRIVAQAERINATWSTGYSRHRLDRHARNPLTLAVIIWDILMSSIGVLRAWWRVRPTHVLIPELASALRNAPALVLLRLAEVEVVAYVLNAPAPGAFYQRAWRWGAALLVDRFVCCSAYARDELLRRAVPERKTLVIHSIAPSRENSTGSVPRDPHTIVYVGQIIPQKGLDLLLDALGMLAARWPDARLVVIGLIQGWVAPAYVGYRERVQDRASAPDLVGRVQFLGWREDVPALLGAGGIHCCPSRPEMLEGLPLVCLEAKRAGVPSVVFPIGPFPEIVSHAEDGWICREVSAAALAEGIEYFLADPARLERASRMARASADRFSRERFADAWWTAFTRP